MPFARLIGAGQLTPQQQHTLELAFNYALRTLDLVDRNDPICELVARKVIEIGTSGIRDAVAIGELAFRQLRAP